ncbi:MAG: NAD-dependent epimerase/dehydratase family protein [Pseudomonadota bacterium]
MAPRRTSAARPRRCIVLGGTGHIGNALARALLGQGHEVTVTCRRDGDRANLQDLDITVLAGDDGHPERLASWIKGQDLVIDAAAPYPIRLFDPAKSGREQRDQALQRSRCLIEAVADLRAEFVYISSFTTLPKQRPWHERLQSAVLQGSHPYFETKAAIEREVVSAAANGLPAIIVNPTVCLGPFDQKPREACFIPTVARGELMGVTGQMLNVIDVRDVADATLGALAEKSYGRPIALSGHNIDLASLVEKISALVGRRPPRMRASTRLTAAGAWWTDALFGAFGQTPPFPSLPFLLLCECRAISPSSGQRNLGLTPRPLETTLEDALRWYQQIGYC